MPQTELSGAGDEWGEISVGEVIRKVSDELIASRQERLQQARPPVFDVASLDIEVSFVVTRTSSGSGGVDLRVVRGDVARTHAREAVNKLTVHLTASALKPGEEEFAMFDATTPLRPRQRFTRRGDQPEDT